MALLGGGGLFDREAEVALLTDLVGRAARGDGTVTLVEGSAGIGKTRLLEEARALARGRGLRSLTARCADLERDFSYGVVRQLFEPTVASLDEDQATAVLAGAAGAASALFARATALSSEAHARQPESIMTTLHALYWLTSNLAERVPLLLLVDDVQWCDGASLRFLDFLARRIDELPVALLVALRWDEAGETRPILAAVAGEPATRRLRLSPLGHDATRSIVGAALGEQPEAPFVAACHTVTSGNPFLLGELVTELSEQGVPPLSERVDDVLRLGPPSIARALELRLAGLTPEAGSLARAVAILGDGAKRSLAAAFCGLSPEATSRASDALTRGCVFGDDDLLRFRHSIQRAAVYASLTRSERSDGHRLAAELLRRDGAPAEQVAAHVLLCEPRSHPDAVEILRQAAQDALACGSPEVAATYLHRALAEPPAPALRSEVLIELCVAEARSPDPGSFESLRRSLALLDNPLERARAAVEVGRAVGMIADIPGALELLDRTIADLGSCDRDLSLGLQAEFISVARLFPATHRRAIERLRSLRPVAATGGVVGAILLANLALERIEEGDLEEAVEHATRALDGGILLAQELWMYAYAANSLAWADRTEDAKRAWAAVFRQAQTRGSITMLHLAAIWRSHLALRCGSVDDAEADARLGLRLCRERAWRYSRSYAVAFLVDALVERDDLDTAERVLDENPAAAELHYRLASEGRLRCAQGRFLEGLELFARCGAVLGEQGGDRNPSVIPWRSGAALAALQLGEHEKARALADEEVSLARAFGARRALGLALRARALLEENDLQIDMLQEAACVLAGSPDSLEHARTLADLGGAIRRTGRRAEAEPHLRTALELAHRCGGVSVRNRAREELLRSGLRPRRFASTGFDSLTASERRVGEQAVACHGNREIAQALFVSLKTVEAHLSSVYRKLGVADRLQLAEVWIREREHVDPQPLRAPAQVRARGS